MILKWAIGGAILGAVGAIWTGTDIAPGILFGGAIGIIIRKWLFRTFWK